jgi:uncharacterized protein (TIGR00255 family)
MSMRSMTGFGTGQAHDGNTTVSVQIAAVNHRGVQVQVRSDLRDLALDELVKQEVRNALQRGSVTVQVSVRSGQVLAIDRARVAAAWEQLASLGRELGAPLPTIDRVVSLVTGERDQAHTGHEGLLRTALASAISELQAQRQREGAALATAFRSQAATLRALLPKLRVSADARAGAYRAALLTRVSELLKDVALTPEQLVREVALHADRIDVTEELVRLAAHIDALDALIASNDDQQGRKLEFLLQEIGREINTTGAKSNDTALTNLVLEAKAVVEQMKEQTANLC